MKSRLALLSVLCFILPHLAYAQFPERWEKIGPVDFTSISNQSPSTLIMTTTHGFIYISKDYGLTWEHHYIDDTLCFEDARFIDSLHGICIDLNGTVLFTADGCATWSRSRIPSELYRAAYTSPDTAYVCDIFGSVWRTTDRGGNWDRQQVSAYALNAIYFFDSRTGFVAGNRGVFAKTTDAGETWITQDIGAGDTTQLFCIDFYDRDTGIVGGLGYAFATTDGGNSWLFRSTPIAWHNRLTTIKLTTSHDFFAFGIGSQAYSSSDLGATINAKLIVGDPAANINGAWYDIGHGALIIGSHGTIEQSTNEGLDWNVLNLCDGADEDYVVNLGDTIISIETTALNNAFFRSDDGGNTWLTYGLDMTPWLGLWFDTPDTGFAIYAAGVSGSEETTDGGVTWTDAGLHDTLKGINWTYDAFASYGNVGYLVGNDSLVENTTDHGATWPVHYYIPLDKASPYFDSPVYNRTLLNVFALDERHAYVAIRYNDTSIGGLTNFKFKYHTRIYETNDAGITWAEMNNAPATPECAAIYFRDTSNGYLSCDSGIIHRTSDGGKTWTTTVLTGNYTIRAINFFNDSIGFASSNNSEIFVTTDKGMMWQNDSLRVARDGTPSPAQSVYKFVFPDSNTVVGVTMNGFYRRKLNLNGSDVVVSNGSSNDLQYLYIHDYPSPTDKVLHCQLDGMYTAPSETLTCGLYDLLGRQMIALTPEAQAGNNGYTSNFTFNVSALSSGVYMLRYTLGLYSCCKPVVIIH